MTFEFLGLGLTQWLGIIGIPSLFAIIGKLYTLIVKIRKKMEQLEANTEDIATIRARQQELMTSVEILMSAQQAQMRKQLIDEFHRYRSAGYIRDEELAEWENQYQAYHSLGANGILDARREELLKLPQEAV